MEVDSGGREMAEDWAGPARMGPAGVTVVDMVASLLQAGRPVWAGCGMWACLPRACYVLEAAFYYVH